MEINVLAKYNTKVVDVYVKNIKYRWDKQMEICSKLMDLKRSARSKSLQYTTLFEYSKQRLYILQ